MPHSWLWINVCKNELKTTRSFAICKIITLPYKSYVCDLILQSNPSIVQVFSILLLQENKGIGKSLGLLFLQGIPHTKVMSQKYNIGISCCYLLGSLGNLCESLGSKHTLIYKWGSDLKAELQREKKICTPMSIEALFMRVKMWKQPKCLWADEWIN